MNGSDRRGSTRVAAAVVATLGFVAALVVGVVPVSAAPGDCVPGPTLIACENAKPGAPASEWDITGSGDDSIQGYATDMSTNRGGRADFKIDTDAAAYSVTIYRMGWYQGLGARRIADVAPSVALPQTQPECLTDPISLNLDCGNWAVSASWDVPNDAVSGVYTALLRRSDTGGTSHITFIVRDDTSTSDVVLQTSDTTWHAYNDYGGTNLYYGPMGPATKVSYNRPFATRGVEEGRDFLFSAEYPLIRFMERNGYDISYISGVDTDRYGSLLLNHETFVSVGHDEYWSGAQRTNVERARDAGVNLAFFSGNEVYWKTRYEASIDGANTPYRTLVTYKETRRNAKTDPSPEWTGTWRDPRFSPPSDGGRPENALTGTAYMSNFTDLPITVSDVEGRLRFWRNTGLATQPSGTSTALAPHTVGYESDEDLDNGFRPAGLFRMSTTTGSTPEYLQDYGSTVAPGTTTHSITMYRAASGALVFGAGTVQWSWGLDDAHDGNGAAPDARMQQATLNLFADMGAQPATLMTGMVMPQPSTDTAGPITTITSPSAGTTVANGSSVTVTGTATDAAGVVAAVEVSLDAGRTWHRATGTTTWTYIGVRQGVGAVDVLARAVDDSANLGTAARVATSVACPCTIFGQTAPTAAPSTDTSALELGIRFVPQTSGLVTGVRFYKGPANTGTHVGTLWSAAGAVLARGTFTAETATGWQELVFDSPVSVTAGTPYVASYHAPNGGYFGVNNAFYAPLDAAPLTVPAATATAGNGVFSPGNTFPTRSFQASNYYVDVTFVDDESVPPIVTARVPVPGVTSVAIDVTPTARLSKVIDRTSLSAGLTRADGGGAVAVTVRVTDVDGGSEVAIDPVDLLLPNTAYVVSVQAADTNGRVMPAAATWRFTTSRGTLTGECPCGLFADTIPDGVSTDVDRPVELGVRITPQRDGTILGVRFLKAAGASGTHIGTLWTAGGEQLARATFTGEGSGGWQEVLFSTPVTVTKGDEYVASYVAPDGRYAYTRDGFGPTGVTRAPLTTRSNAGGYTYTTGEFPAVPSTANYWVDVLFQPAPDLSPPTLTSRTPESGTSSVAVTTSVAATLSELVDPASVTATLSGGGSQVPVSIVVADVDGVSQVAVTPDATLVPGLTYTVSILATDLVGNAMTTPVTWTFRTARQTPPPGQCPCSLFDDTTPAEALASLDTRPVTLGVTFTADTEGSVLGVRFLKAPGNDGAHVGAVWSATGERLATATFTGETTSGWQEVRFDTPVRVTAGTSYTASYESPGGRYSYTANGFAPTGRAVGPLTAGATAGVFTYQVGLAPTATSSANYWVDVLFEPTPPDLDPPTVVATTPTASATEVSTAADVTVSFAAPVAEGTAELVLVDTTTNALVAGRPQVDATGGTATFSPATPLPGGRVYRATVSGAQSRGGVTMTPYSFIFTTTTSNQCPCTLFDDRSPATASASDRGTVEVGTRFVPGVDGRITAVRFYKGPSNTGPHVATVWSAAGVALRQVTFTAESASGWQSATLATPLDVTAGTDYVVSYLAPAGGYAFTEGVFTTAWTRGPLTAPADTLSARNGVYRYGGGFPSDSSGPTSYFVDVVFSPADGVAPTLTARTPPQGATSVAVGAVVTATFSEPVSTASVTLDLTIGGALVPGSTTYDPPSRTVTFRPRDALPPSASATASASARDYDGVGLAGTTSWTFTTGPADAEPGTCPCTLLDPAVAPAVAATSDTDAIEVGIQFVPELNGRITGIRFYKGAGNTGTHVGTVWSASGQALAQVTFTGETASGWQDAIFATPIPVVAGAAYTASYTAPQGRYAATPDAFTTTSISGPLRIPGGGNGVYRYGGGYPTASFRSTNYFVDVVFASDDTNAPVIASRTPAPGAVDVDPATTISATFSEPVVAASASLAVAADGIPVSGTTSYTAATRSVTFRPAAALPASTLLTATVAARDVDGRALTGPTQWSFTTQATGTAPTGIFGPGDSPDVAATDDTSMIEVGVRIVPQVDGLVTGVRFYKGSGNGGVHTATLWSTAGQPIATATFAAETATGWQSVTFDQPVSVSAGTEYVASYLAPQGRYSVTGNSFGSTTTVGQLTIPGPDNGVYRYGGGFPTGSFRSTNYWVDVMFQS